MALHKRKTIDLEQGWELMQKGITKLKNILEGLPEPQFSSEDYMMLYTIIYNMCTQKPPHDYSQQLYDKYRESFVEYITATVLPSLREKHDEFMLRELVRRWTNHKVMVRWLSRFFHYLDRYFIARRSLPALNEVGLTCFRDLVYQEIKVKVRDAVIFLIDQEREGEQIDRALLKNVLDIFVEIGLGSMYCYKIDFEPAMLEDTAAYYSQKASNWILEDSCPDYMLKAVECLMREKERVAHYLHSSSEPKLLEKVQHELLTVYMSQLLEKEHSGCNALRRDDKVDDISRMYKLFCRIPRGLDPVSSIFKQHVTLEGLALVKQAEDAASNKMETLMSSFESVKNMIRDMELHEDRAKQAKEEASKAGLEMLTKAEDLKEMLKHAKEAKEMQTGEVCGEKSKLATEAWELQFRLLNLWDEEEKSLSIIEEMYQTLEARLAIAKEEQSAAEQEKFEKEEAASKILKEQEVIMEEIVEESKRLQQESEENAKLRDFLMDRGHIINILQGEIAVICEDVKLLKERVNGHVPPSKSLLLTSSSLASSSCSSSNVGSLSEKILHTVDLGQAPEDPTRNNQLESSVGDSGNSATSDDDWELFEW